MSGPNIHKGEIKKLIIEKIKTKEDWELLYNTFGIRNGENLLQWFKGEFNIGYKEIINHINSLK
jgi:hypothetical protein